MKVTFWYLNGYDKFSPGRRAILRNSMSKLLATKNYGTSTGLVFIKFTASKPKSEMLTMDDTSLLPGARRFDEQDYALSKRYPGFVTACVSAGKVQLYDINDLVV